MAVAAAAAALPLCSKLAPFNPASEAAIDAAIRFIQLKPGEIAVDIGCGDGRVLLAIAASCPGAQAFGVEYNEELAARAHARIDNAGILNAKVLCGDATLSENQPAYANAVFVYLTPTGLAAILPYLESVVLPGGRVVSNAFRVPGWEERGLLRETFRDTHGLAAYCYALPLPDREEVELPAM